MIITTYEYLNFNRPMNKVNTFDSQRYSNHQNHCSITGMVERVTFHNSENGFCVIKVKINGRDNLVTVIGNSISILAGQNIEASGYWVREKDYGLQFKAEILKILAPTTIEAIEKYLASGVIKSIGPVYAQKLVQIFGTEILDIIENKDLRLMKVPGISSIRAKNIWESWDKQKIIKDIMLFINNYNIGASKAIKIYKAYGEDAVNIIKSNPYRLAADIHGIGFKTADEIGTSIGIAPFSMLRIRAGIHYSLMTCINKGSCGLPTNTLIDLCYKLLTVNTELILEALSLEINERKVVVENINGAECIFLKGLAFAELRTAEILLYINRIQPPWGKLDDLKIQQYIGDLIDIKLSTSQLRAMQSAFTSKVMVITGGPGVGKTTLINSIITVFKKLNMKVLLAAPTGRATKRISEAAKHPAYTIHRLIRRSPNPNQEKKQNIKLRCDLLILDEMSMVDVSMMYAVLSSLPSTAALFLVGDPDQLPSVGPGQVFKDLIDSTVIPTVRLTEIFRQENNSSIINNAMRINNGIMPTLRHKNDCSTPTDFYFIDSDTPENAADQIVSLVSTRLPARFGISPFTDIQVLSPMTKGAIGTHNLNLLLQAALLPHIDSKDALSIWGSNFKLGDKVMQTTNNYDKDVYNGDIGVIIEINRTNQTIIIKFDNREVCYDFYELDEIVLAYAITVHKSQGSEYHTVIIPLMTQHYIMLQRKLIYTAITRAKHMVIIIGQKKALAIAVKNNIEEQRYSTLYKRLVELNINKNSLLLCSKFK